MRIRKLLKEDDAVSPVIGVILMVAITVILAAVIASFVLGLGDSTSDVQPNASFSFDYEDSSNTVTITHDQGETVEAGEIKISGEQLGDGSVQSEFSDTWDSIAGIGSTSEIGSGDDIELDANSDYEADVIWESSDSDDTATLSEGEGPDA